MRGSLSALTAAIACVALTGRAAAEPPQGKVSVTFTSASKQAPLQIGAFEGESVVATDRWGGVAVTRDRCRQLCATTPCTLQLPPGRFQLCAGYGDTLPHKIADLDVPSTGADVRLRVPSDAMQWVGFAFTTGGVLFAIAGGLTLASWGVDGTGTSSSKFVAGSAVLGVGAALLAVGIPVLVINRDGVASMSPREAAALPTAKLIFGAGGMGVNGTF